MKVRKVDYYADEFLVGTRDLSDVAVGIYWRACSLIYSHNGPIPISELRRWCKSPGKNFNQTVNGLVAAGKLVRKGDQISVRRVSDELQKALRRVSEWRQNGARGGRHPKHTNGLDEPSGSPARVTLTLEEEDSVSPRGDTAPPATPTAPIDPVKELWDGALSILGDSAKARRLIGRLRKDYGDTAVLSAIVETQAEWPSEPAAYLIGCCKRNHAKRGNGADYQRALDILGQAALDHDERESHRSDHQAPD